jgi:hypothetical protein
MRSLLSVASAWKISIFRDERKEAMALPGLIPCRNKNAIVFGMLLSGR